MPRQFVNSVSAPPALPSALPSAEILHHCLFETQLGWMILSGGHNQVCALTFGHFTAEQAEQAWRERRFPSRGYKAGPQLRLLSEDWFPECREALERYAAGETVDLVEFPCHLEGMPPFRQKVLRLVHQIPRGEVLTYGEIAARLENPGAARAVGGTMAHNPIPLLIPCHRVMGAQGRLTGFSAPEGVHLKKKLLNLEQSCDSRQKSLFFHGRQSIKK